MSVNMTSLIQYYPDLIQNLRDDHQKLIRQITMLNHLANTNKFKLIVTMLSYFKRSLLEHIHEENLKLYIFLQTKLPSASDEYMQMRKLRKDMNNILIQVVDFLQIYKSVDQKKMLQETFISDLNKVTNLLSKRVHQEEVFLYTVYENHNPSLN